MKSYGSAYKNRTVRHLLTWVLYTIDKKNLFYVFRLVSLSFYDAVVELKFTVHMLLFSLQFTFTVL
jgi:hypothetical protein